MSEKHKLTLFVSGNSFSSQQAIRNLKQIFRHPDIAKYYEMEIVDILRQPERAESEHLYATPTLLKLNPPPKLLVVGHLYEQELIISKLCLSENDFSK